MEQEPDAAGAPLEPVRESDHVRGGSPAPFTLVQYGDYECPSSRRVYAFVRELLDEGKPLRFVFRHFPLERVHPHAAQAAEAAEAAAAQGQFWPMHDRLYRNQLRLEEADLLRHAERLGLDVRPFEEALTSGAYRVRVRQDQRGGVRAGLRTTMALFLNGELHEGERRVAMALRAVREQRT